MQEPGSPADRPVEPVNGAIADSLSSLSDARPESFAKAAPPATIESLFRDHFEDVYRVVGRLLGPVAPRADVEDLTQQVFLTAHRALPRFRGESKPMTWLYGIAARTVMTHRRGWGRRLRMLRGLAAEPRRDEGRSGGVERDVASRRELNRVGECLGRIKPKKRTVYVLYELEGMSGAEIAQVLGIPEATVWTRLHHARRELLGWLDRSDSESLP